MGREEREGKRSQKQPEMDKKGWRGWGERRDVRKTGEDSGREEGREEGRGEKRKEGREGERVEEKKRTERVSQWGEKASKEQGRNCQARPGFFPFCVLDQPWASASALRGYSPGPGQHGRLPLCISPSSQELKVP